MDRTLPNTRPLKDALAVYGKRLGWFLLVVAVNLISLGFIVLTSLVSSSSIWYLMMLISAILGVYALVWKSESRQRVLYKWITMRVANVSRIMLQRIEGEALHARELPESDAQIRLEEAKRLLDALNRIDSDLKSARDAAKPLPSMVGWPFDLVVATLAGTGITALFSVLVAPPDLKNITVVLYSIAFVCGILSVALILYKSFTSRMLRRQVEEITSLLGEIDLQSEFIDEQHNPTDSTDTLGRPE